MLRTSTLFNAPFLIVNKELGGDSAAKGVDNTGPSGASEKSEKKKHKSPEESKMFV